VTVANANPSLFRVPVEFECMADYRPFWKGEWHLRLFRPDGREVPCQEEQPEALLPFNDWRRRISFIDDLPGVGVSRYKLRAFEGPAGSTQGRMKGAKEEYADKTQLPVSALPMRIDRRTGLVKSLRSLDGIECLSGPLLEPLVIEDTADSWGTGSSSYGKIAGRFKPEGPPRVIQSGPVRTITQSAFSFKKSRIVMDLYSYPEWPVLEFRLRIIWNEERRRLKLRIPTRLRASSVLCEVPGAAVERPSDGQEHVHGRWLLIEGRAGGGAAAVGVATSGQHGFDYQDGEVRLSVLRSAAYCHERGFDLDSTKTRDVGIRTTGTCPRSWKFADIGVHDVRLLVTAGSPDNMRSMLPGLVDYLSTPPAAYAHLPAGVTGNSTELLALTPASIRLLACKRSWDGEALVVRLQEATGKRTRANLSIEMPPFNMPERTTEEMMVEMAAPPAPRARRRTKILPRVQIPLSFRSFEIKTVRVEKDGRWSEVRMIEEDRP
jgi:alpha-mannosidase